MSRPSVLIIGHGYIGAALGTALHRAGHSIIGVSRSHPAQKDYPLEAADVSNPDSIRELKAKMKSALPEVIVHCAASGRGGGIDSYRSVYLNGMHLLRENFPAIPVIFTSSTSVYAQTDGSVVTEDSDTTLTGETGQILLESESVALETGGTALRLAGIYGPSRSIYLRRLLEGTAAIETGNKSRFLNQIHQADVVSAIRHVIDQGIESHSGRTYNVVDDGNLNQRSCYEQLAAALELPLPSEASTKETPKRAWTNKAVSNAALRATGWQPQYPSLIEALKSDASLLPSIKALLG